MSDSNDDPLERNMKHLFSTQPDLEEHPPLSRNEREGMLRGIMAGRKPLLSKKFIFFCITFGMLIPIAAILVEAHTHVFATDLHLDPLPTVGHLILCASVPLINLLLFLQVKGRVRIPANLRTALVGLAFGVSLFYIVTFVKMLPIIGVGLLFSLIGFGLLALLPLSPHFGALSAWLLARKIAKAEGTPRTFTPLPLATGFAFGLIAILGFAALHFKRVQTLEVALAQDGPIPTEQLANLDGLVSQQWMHRAAQTPPVKIPGLSKKRWHIGRNGNSVHMAYYQLYGQSAAKYYYAPQSIHQSLHTDHVPAWIGRQISDLRLASSEMEGWVDADAGLGYIEWTQILLNHDDEADEGRQHIELPPGGVVSRVTLWVNGEPREAAFDTIAKTRAAYEYIVKRKRDPVLVNALSEDKVQVECYPVPARNADGTPGQMKYRIGITFPVPATSTDQAEFELPRIVSRNFVLVRDFEHTLALESGQPIEGLERTGVLEQRTAYPVNQITRSSSEPDRVLRLPRNPDIAAVTAHDPVTREPVVARLRDLPQLPMNRLAIVVDRSRPMARHHQDLIAMPIEAILAEHGLEPNNTEVRWFPDDAHQAEGYIGGVDAAPELQRAIGWAGSGAQTGPSNGLVVWFHGAQPMPLASTHELEWVVSAKSEEVTLHAVSLNDDDNWIADRLLRTTAKHTDLSPAEGLRVALKSTRAKHSGYHWSRERVAPESTEPLPKTQVMEHLAKLIAHQEIMDGLAESRDEDVRKAISDKAVAYKLVTPVSAAIVLETREDYIKHGLKPPEDEGLAQGSVVPEPDTLFMILFGAALLVGYRRLKERFGSREV